MGAFSVHAQDSKYENSTSRSLGSHAAVNLTVQATRGLTQLLQRQAGSSRGVLGSLSLPDGRLNAGTHLPLLARRYKYVGTLGEGASAQVLLAEDSLRSGSLVTIKVLRRHYGHVGEREARALRFLHAAGPSGIAPGLIRLLGTFSLGGHLCLVLERLHPRLLDYVAQSSTEPPAQALRGLRKIAHQLLMALAHLHACGVVHADIKPDNILLCEPPGCGAGLRVRLADLGSCFSCTETDTRRVGQEVQTLPYRAPEAALGLPYGSAIDLWSLGVVLAEVALRRPLLPVHTPADLLHQMIAVLGPLPEPLLHNSALARQLDLQRHQRCTLGATLAQAPQGLGPAALTPALTLRRELTAVDFQLADCVLRMLTPDPTERITARQALLHPFFDELCPIWAAFPEILAEAPRLLPSQAEPAFQGAGPAPAPLLVPRPESQPGSSGHGAAPGGAARDLLAQPGSDVAAATGVSTGQVTCGPLDGHGQRQQHSGPPDVSAPPVAAKGSPAPELDADKLAALRPGRAAPLASGSKQQAAATSSADDEMACAAEALQDIDTTPQKKGPENSAQADAGASRGGQQGRESAGMPARPISAGQAAKPKQRAPGGKAVPPNTAAKQQQQRQRTPSSGLAPQHRQPSASAFVNQAREWQAGALPLLVAQAAESCVDTPLAAAPLAAARVQAPRLTHGAPADEAPQYSQTADTVPGTAAKRSAGKAAPAGHASGKGKRSAEPSGGSGGGQDAPSSSGGRPPMAGKRARRDRADAKPWWVAG